MSLSKKEQPYEDQYAAQGHNSSLWRICVGHGISEPKPLEAEDRYLCRGSLQRSIRFKIGVFPPNFHFLRPSHCRGREFESHHLHQIQMNLNGS